MSESAPMIETGQARKTTSSADISKCDSQENGESCHSCPAHSKKGVVTPLFKNGRPENPDDYLLVDTGVLLWLLNERKGVRDFQCTFCSAVGTTRCVVGSGDGLNSSFVYECSKCHCESEFADSTVHTSPLVRNSGTGPGNEERHINKVFAKALQNSDMDRDEGKILLNECGVIVHDEKEEITYVD